MNLDALISPYVHEGLEPAESPLSARPRHRAETEPLEDTAIAFGPLPRHRALTVVPG